jgi:hypothetical protein
MQPWQGATFIAVIGVTELICLRRERRPLGPVVRDLALPVAAALAPLIYYFVLSQVDDSWKLAAEVNDFPRWAWWVTVIGLAPLAIPAAFAYRRPARDFGAVALRVWPITGLVIFYQPAGTFPFHAFQGLSYPLTVLAVIAVRGWLGERPVPVGAAVAVVLTFCVLGTIYRANELREAVNYGLQPFFLEPDEREALRYLESRPEPGGVLTPVYSGIVLPAYTGRETWIGAGSWTPNADARREAAEHLFAGRMTTAEARALVRRSGARFLYSDCHGRANIDRIVRPFTAPPKRIGCATVYMVR